MKLYIPFGRSVIVTVALPFISSCGYVPMVCPSCVTITFTEPVVTGLSYISTTEIFNVVFPMVLFVIADIFVCVHS